MKNFSFLKFWVCVFFLSLTSCRQESLAIENQKEPSQKIGMRVLTNEEFRENKGLADKIEDFKERVFRPGAALKGETVQDSLLEGAIIETSKVLEIKQGGWVSYTFPVSRSYPNNKIENLVLRKNTDNTYSGILLQYTLSAEDRNQIKNGSAINLSQKYRAYRIDNINISSRVQTDVVGCLEITWETGYCISGEHYTGETGCDVGGAPAAQIVSIKDNCNPNTGGGGDAGGVFTGIGNGSGGGSPAGGATGGSSGSGSGTSNPYNTFIFTSFDDQFNPCSEGDTDCQTNWANNAYAASFFNALPYKARTLSEYSPIFFMVRDYLVENNDPQMMEERLYLIGGWFAQQDSSTPEKKLANYKFAHWALDFLKENPDTIEPENFLTRISALENAVAQDPNKLLNIPCNQLSLWQDLALHQVPQSVKNKIKSIPQQNSYWPSWRITDLDDGAGARINMDLFPIKISNMPNKPNGQKYTPAEFFEFFRKNINLFAETFTPIEDNYYNIHDTALWNSSNPLGALIHITIIPDSGTVVCSGVSTNTWIFSTMKAPFGVSYDGIHPVSGNRLFSYYMQGSTMYIYTRGVDRTTYIVAGHPKINNFLESTAFAGADRLWKGMQDKISAYVNSHGGDSDSVPAVKYRPNYEGIKKYLKGQIPLSSVGCN